MHHRQANLASLTALLMAAVFVVAWLLRLSVLVNFISESILTGFKAGAALVIAATQLPKLLGVAGGGDNFFERIWLLVQQADATNLTTLAIGLVAIGLLLTGGRLLPGWPVALGVVLLSLLAMWLGRLDQYGVKIVGEIPAGLPQFRWSGADLATLQLPEVRQLVRLASACFLLSYIESVSAARTFALKHRYEIDSRQELLGLGAASLLAGLFQGYPVAGGLSQSAVNERSGAQTPLSLVFASAAICCVLLFLTGLFRTLPDAILAAVVLVAVTGLIDIARAAPPVAREPAGLRRRGGGAGGRALHGGPRWRPDRRAGLADHAIGTQLAAACGFPGTNSRNQSILRPGPPSEQ